jgi:type I restriction enzyme, S subunit
MEVKLGYKLTDVGIIPEDWDVELLDSIAKRGSGHTPDKKHSEYWNGGIKWISLRDSDRLDALYINDTVAKITPAGIANSSAVIHPVGTVVLSRDAGVGKSAIMRDAMAVSQHFIAWQCGPRLDNHFLYYWLQAKKLEFERIAFGNTIKTIGLPYFKKLMIPLPPLPEQRAIAAALSDVDALLVSLERLIAKKRNIKHAAMQQLLTGRIRLPGFSGVWEDKRFGEVFQFLSTANNSRSDLTDIGEIGYIHYGDIHTKWRTFLDCSRDKIPYIQEGKIRNVQLLEEGDLIMADASEDYEGIGISIEVKNVGSKKIVAGLHTLLLRGNKEIVSDGFKGYLQYIPSVKDSLRKAATGISVYGISKNNLKNITVNLPCTKEQSAIAETLSDIDAEII